MPATIPSAHVDLVVYPFSRHYYVDNFLVSALTHHHKVTVCIAGCHML